MKKVLFIGLVLSVFVVTGLPMTTLAVDKAPVENQLAAADVATINVNTATPQELRSLPGIGKVTASRIVEYRDEHGKFTSVEGLLKVKGIGKKSLEKFRDLISLE